MPLPLIPIVGGIAADVAAAAAVAAYGAAKGVKKELESSEKENSADGSLKSATQTTLQKSSPNAGTKMRMVDAFLKYYEGKFYRMIERIEATSRAYVKELFDAHWEPVLDAFKEKYPEDYEEFRERLESLTFLDDNDDAAARWTPRYYESVRKLWESEI